MRANGDGLGVNERRIRELADWYKDETHRRYNDGTLDVPTLDAELRAILREEVDLPEHGRPCRRPGGRVRRLRRQGPGLGVPARAVRGR